MTITALGLLACAVVWAGTTIAGRRSGGAPQPFPSDSPPGHPQPRNESVLSSGETIQVGSAAEPVRRLESEEIAHRLAWTRGEVHLNGQTLSEAVEEFNRYNRLKLLIGDAAIAGLHVSGTFQARDPRAFVAALEHSNGVRAQTIAAAGSSSEVISLVAANTPR